jgi:hypothetical protein
MGPQHQTCIDVRRQWYARPVLAAVLVLALIAPLSAHRPAAAAPSVEGTVTDGHRELLAAMRTLSTADLRSFTPGAVRQVRDLLDQFRGFNATVRPLGELEITDSEQFANSATVWTYEVVNLTYFGLPAQAVDVYITWSLVRTPGGWLVDAVEVELDI